MDNNKLWLLWFECWFGREGEADILLKEWLLDNRWTNQSEKLLQNKPLVTNRKVQRSYKKIPGWCIFTSTHLSDILPLP